MTAGLFRSEWKTSASVLLEVGSNIGGYIQGERRVEPYDFLLRGVNERYQYINVDNFVILSMCFSFEVPFGINVKNIYIYIY